MGIGPQSHDHGLANQLGRVLLDRQIWLGKIDWRVRLMASLPPEYLMRRWNVAKQKPSYPCKTYASFQNWLFANMANKLEAVGHIERQYPDNDKGESNALFNVRLTDSGLAAKTRDLEAAKNAAPGSVLIVLLPGKLKRKTV